MTQQSLSSTAETRSPQQGAGGAGNIEREALAARNLRESLGQLADDEDLALDMIEGETSLVECIDKLLEQNTADRALVEGIAKVMSELDGRGARVERRIDMRRALIEQAMMTAEIKKLERPTATLTMANRRPSLRIDDEASIPAEFWTAGAPKLDRKALTAALAERPVAGAALSNAAPSLTVRIK